MTEHEPSAWHASIAEFLDGLGVDWALMGALAANRYRATPRFTTDIDVMIAEADAAIEGLTSLGYSVEVIADDSEPPHLVRARNGDQLIDLLLPVVEYQRIALQRSTDNVLTVEDVVIHKLIAWRPRDRDDVRSIIEAGARFDMRYLDRWVDAWDLSERWATFDDLRRSAD
ncbi:MAG: hypothetical protein AAGG08_00215 [Actinomycetota bacterium]